MRKREKGVAARGMRTRSEGQRNKQGSSEVKKNCDLDRVPLTRRSIRYFTEDCGAPGAGCRGKVRRTLMKCFISQQSKGECFFSVDRNSEVRRTPNREE